ncbi:DUF2182 domain-containing protein [Aquamicrobium sp. LC103]|uniref:DUF2182 domain-containing protein n=1 Tax=Aquamicrobium sp. LC103 TaxID=1120658 RepID=UPI000B128AFC|nr:DUF2182 domain-containing protein [Aquamicrobium sp. LC103]
MSIWLIAIAMHRSEQSFDNLDAAGRATARVSVRPGVPVVIAVVLAAVLAWAVLAAMAAQAARIAPLEQGPGGFLLEILPEIPLPAFMERFFLLCLTPAPAQDPSPGGIAALTAMWFLMAIAMMLPSAAPMIRTYCEIADTAAGKGERAVHPVVLVCGYLAVWLAASFGFALLSALLAALGASTGAAAPVVGTAGAAALFVAGLYQFSSLKHACLEKCRNPFGVLFSRWSTKRSRIFVLGAEQGMWCLGCCWALMLVMFAVGSMNIFWMALVGMFSLVEKQIAGSLSTRIAGAILLVWSAALLFISL